jgi:cation transport regulator ChaC
MRRGVAAAVIASILAAACGASPANGPYIASVGPGLHPRLTADDAVRITREYLDAQREQL